MAGLLASDSDGGDEKNLFLKHRQRIKNIGQARIVRVLCNGYNREVADRVGRNRWDGLDLSGLKQALSPMHSRLIQPSTCKI